jgi:hypothetical protein
MSVLVLLFSICHLPGLIKLLGVLELMFVIKKEKNLLLQIMSTPYNLQPQRPLPLLGMRMHMGKLSKVFRVCKLWHLRIVKPLKLFYYFKGSVMVAQECTEGCNLRYGRFRDMEMGSAHANSVALCLYLIRASQSFGKEDLRTVNFFSLAKFHPKKFNLKIWIRIFFQEFPDLLEILLNFREKKFENFFPISI